MSKRVAVIGCGIFGAVSAIRLAEAGAEVTVYERLARPLLGASLYNQNRLHLGFHYPRDFATAKQCARGFYHFREEFPEAVVGGFPNVYFVASEGSRTSPGDYLTFARRLGVSFEEVDPVLFDPPVRGTSLGIRVPEAVYDVAILREIVQGRLGGVGVRCLFGREVGRISRRGSQFLLDEAIYDAVVDCTYAGVGRFGEMLGHPRQERQYEYTVIPIVAWDHYPVGVTVMDGAFMTVLPYGRTKEFLLYHVEHSVLARIVTDRVAEVVWPATTARSRAGVLGRILAAAITYVPSLTGARVTGCLEGPRVVLSGVDATDARPSIVAEPESNYLTVLSGKVDHCLEVADEVVARLGLLREIRL